MKLKLRHYLHLGSYLLCTICIYLVLMHALHMFCIKSFRRFSSSNQLLKCLCFLEDIHISSYRLSFLKSTRPPVRRTIEIGVGVGLRWPDTVDQNSLICCVDLNTCKIYVLEKN